MISHRNRYSVPFFEVLAHARRWDDGSKLHYCESNWSKPYLQLTSPKSKKYVWAGRLAERVVRRYKIPAAFVYELDTKIRKKYALTHLVPAFLPEPFASIGFLELKETVWGDIRIGATGEARSFAVGNNFLEGDPAIIAVAKYRYEKLKTLLKKKDHPEGDELIAWVISTELERLIYERSKEQSRFRRQQGRRANVNGKHDRAVS